MRLDPRTVSSKAYRALLVAIENGEPEDDPDALVPATRRPAEVPISELPDRRAVLARLATGPVVAADDSDVMAEAEMDDSPAPISRAGGPRG